MKVSVIPRAVAPPQEVCFRGPEEEIRMLGDGLEVLIAGGLDAEMSGQSYAYTTAELEQARRDWYANGSRSEGYDELVRVDPSLAEMVTRGVGKAHAILTANRNARGDRGSSSDRDREVTFYKMYRDMEPLRQALTRTAQNQAE